MHAVVGTLIAQTLQVFEQLSGTTALAFGPLGLEVQPLGQGLLKFTQLRLGGLLAPVLGWFGGRLTKVFANGIAREASDISDGTDGLAVHLMHTPDLQRLWSDRMTQSMSRRDNC